MRKYLPVAAVGVLCLGVGFLLAHPPASASTRAADIVESCAAAKDKAACYEASVPTLYPSQTTTELFELVRELRVQDPSYQFCHVLAHKIGERVVAEDPAGWVEAMALNPKDGICSNGFIHGVVGGRFRAEVLDTTTIETLIPDFTRACEPRPTWQASNLDRAMCYHGMGHLYVFITDADVPHALELCADTTPEDFERVCVEGVFMQLFQPLEPDDFALIARLPVALTQESVRPYCATFREPEFEGACLRESWPLWSDGIRDGSAVRTFCADQPNSEQEDNCYETTSAIIGRQTLGEPQKARSACAAFPPQREAHCLFVAATAILEEQRTDTAHAVAFCSESGDYAEECYVHLASRARFMFGANEAERKAFCTHLPVTVQTLCESY